MAEIKGGSIVINGTITKWVLGIVGSVVALSYALLINSVSTLTYEIRELQRFEAATNANRFTDQDAGELYERIILYHHDNTPPADVVLLLQQYDERLDRLEGNN